MAAQSAVADEAALRMVFPRLVAELKASDVIDELYQKNLLKKNEYEGILDASFKVDSKDVTRRVLMAVGRRPAGFVPALVEVLNKKYRSLADALEKALADVTSRPQTDPAPPHQLARASLPSSGVAAATYVKVLEEQSQTFLQEMKSTAIAPKLRALSLIPQEVENSIQHSRSEEAANQCLLTFLKENATEKQVLGVFRSASEKEGFGRMHKFAVSILRQLQRALPGTAPIPLQGEPHAAPSTSAPGPAREGEIPSGRPGYAATHPLSPTLRNVCWPEFRTLHNKFSAIVSKLFDVLCALKPDQFKSLLVYLGERLRPMVDGCFPAEGSPDLPDGRITPLVLIQHLQKRHYWDYRNTDLIEDIIRHIYKSILQGVSRAANSLQALMTGYKKNTCSKVTRTLEECKKKKVKSPPNYTTMAVEISPGGDPLSYHLYQILQLKELLVNTFGVRGALFAGWSEGSIVLYFFIPEEAAYSLCPKLESSCAALQHLHVTTVVVFEHFSVDVGYQRMALLHKTMRISGSQEEVRPPRIKKLQHSVVAESPDLHADSGIASKSGSTSSLYLLKQDSEVTSKWAGVPDKTEAHIADLRHRKAPDLAEDSGSIKSNATSTSSLGLLKAQSELTSQLEAANAKQEARIAELQQKDDAKTKKLEAIERMTAGIARKLFRMNFDETKKLFKDIHRMSLSPSVEETAEPLPSVVPPKKPASASSEIKAATKKERHTKGPETYEQRNVTLRNRPPIPPTKPTSMPRRK